MTSRWEGLTPGEIGASERAAWERDLATGGGRERGPVNPARLADVPHTRFEGPVFQVRRRTPAQLTDLDGTRHDAMVEGLHPTADGGRVLLLRGPDGEVWACVRADGLPWPARGDHGVEVVEPDLRLAAWRVPADVADRPDEVVPTAAPTREWRVRTTAIGVDDEREARLRAEGYADRAREREAGLRHDGDIAEYRGRLLRVLSSDDRGVKVPRAHAEEHLFPDAVESGRGPQGPWVLLPRQALTRLFRRTVAARWRGEDVSVRGPARDGQVFVAFHGSPDRARELGLDGDPERGFHVRVPVAALSGVHDVDDPLPLDR